MAFRGATALFGHFGVEADLTELDERDEQDLAHAIGIYKRFRSLLHTGDLYRIDCPPVRRSGRGAAAVAYSVVALDRTEALVSLVQLTTESSLAPGRLVVPGLQNDRQYSVEFVPMSAGQRDGTRLGPALEQPRWLVSAAGGDEPRISGAVLGRLGLVRPVLWPESAIVLHLSCA